MISLQYIVILVLLVVVNLLLCLIYKLNFIIGRCALERTLVLQGSVLSVLPGTYWGSWNMSPVRKGKNYCIT